MQGKAPADRLVKVQDHIADIEHHMLHFIENHDEQRVASPPFAGNAFKGKPAMVVSATIGTAPTLVYFGQEVGEPGAENAGFGKPSRTSIFDYIGVPNHQRWMNGGAFDGGKLSDEEKSLRNFYKKLLNFTITSPALMGKYAEIQSYNSSNSAHYSDKILSYARWCDKQKLLVVTCFDADKENAFDLLLPPTLIQDWNLKDGNYLLYDQLNSGNKFELMVVNQTGKVKITLKPLESVILELKN